MGGKKNGKIYIYIYLETHYWQEIDIKEWMIDRTSVRSHIVVQNIYTSL